MVKLLAKSVQANFFPFEKAPGLYIPAFRGIFSPRCQGFAAAHNCGTLGAGLWVKSLELAKK